MFVLKYAIKQIKENLIISLLTPLLVPVLTILIYFLGTNQELEEVILAFILVGIYIVGFIIILSVYMIKWFLLLRKSSSKKQYQNLIKSKFDYMNKKKPDRYVEPLKTQIKDSNGKSYKNLSELLKKRNGSNDNILLTGEGGLGKSTLMVQTMHDLLYNKDYKKFIPYYVDLKTVYTENIDKKAETNNYSILHHIISERSGIKYISKKENESTLINELAENFKGKINKDKKSKYIILADGYNELSLREKELFINNNTNREIIKDDALIVISSRYNMLFEKYSEFRYVKEYFDYCELQKLTDTEIENYIDKVLKDKDKQEIIRIKTNFHEYLNNVLKNRMTLQLYLNYEKLKEKYENKKIISEPRSRGEIYYNFILIHKDKILKTIISSRYRSLKDKNYSTTLHEIAFNTLENIAYKFFMENRLVTTKDEIVNDIKEFLLPQKVSKYGNFNCDDVRYNDCNRISVQNNTITYKDGNDEKVETIQETARNILKILIQSYSYIIYDNQSRRYTFSHESFRDFLAGLYVFNSNNIKEFLNSPDDDQTNINKNLYMFKNQILPPDIIKTLGEINEQHKLKVKYNGNGDYINQQHNTNLDKLVIEMGKLGNTIKIGHILHNIFEIFNTSEKDLSNYDFSGLDLKGVNLNGVELGRGRKVTDDSQRSERFKGTIIYRDNLFPPKDWSSVVCLAETEEEIKKQGKVHTLFTVANNGIKEWQLSGSYSLGINETVSGVKFIDIFKNKSIITTDHKVISNTKDFNVNNNEDLYRDWENVLLGAFFTNNDEKIIIIAENYIEILDTQKDKNSFKLPFENEIKFSAISPERKKIILIQSINGNDTINEYEIDQLKQKEKRPKPVNPGSKDIRLISYINENEIVFVSGDKDIYRYNITDNQTAQIQIGTESPDTITLDNKQIKSILVSKHENEMYLGLDDGMVRKLDYDKNINVKLLDRLYIACYRHIYLMDAVKSDDTYKLVHSGDNSIKEWEKDGNDLICNKIYPGFGANTNNVYYLDKGEHVISSSDEGIANIFKAKTGHIVKSLHDEEFKYERVFVYYDNDGTRDTIIYGVEGKKGRIKKITKPKGTGYDNMSISKTIVTQVLDDSGKNVKINYMDQNPINENIIVICYANGMVVEWDISPLDDEKAKQISEYKLTKIDDNSGKSEQVKTVFYNKDATHILIASHDGTARELKVTDENGNRIINEIQVIDTDKAVDFAVYNPDETKILISCGDFNVYEVDRNHNNNFNRDIKNESNKKTMTGHEFWMRMAIYSPNGKVLSTSNDGTLREWDSNGNQKDIIRNIPGLFVQGCDFSLAKLDKSISSNDKDQLFRYGSKT